MEHEKKVCGRKSKMFEEFAVLIREVVARCVHSAKLSTVDVHLQSELAYDRCSAVNFLDFFCSGVY